MYIIYINFKLFLLQCFFKHSGTKLKYCLNISYLEKKYSKNLKNIKFHFYYLFIFNLI